MGVTDIRRKRPKAEEGKRHRRARGREGERGKVRGSNSAAVGFLWVEEGGGDPEYRDLLPNLILRFWGLDGGKDEDLQVLAMIIGIFQGFSLLERPEMGAI